jgi:hypothetical protein
MHYYECIHEHVLDISGLGTGIKGFCDGLLKKCCGIICSFLRFANANFFIFEF